MHGPSLFERNDGRGALLSEDGRYRYRLWRLWDELAPVMTWVMLNPSTADAEVDDPTIRKCIGFAKQHHYGGIVVVNLFAYRATDPKELGKVKDPVGPENDQHILWACTAPLMLSVVAGWGTAKTRLIRERAARVRANIQSCARRGHQVFQAESGVSVASALSAVYVLAVGAGARALMTFRTVAAWVRDWRCPIFPYAPSLYLVMFLALLGERDPMTTDRNR